MNLNKYTKRQKITEEIWFLFNCQWIIFYVMILLFINFEWTTNENKYVRMKKIFLFNVESNNVFFWFQILTVSNSGVARLEGGLIFFVTNL